jgi:hypothetical protein
MANGYLTAAKIRHEVIVDGKSYGYFNGGDLEWGSETASVDDPEDGNVPVGGRQTGGSIEFNRPWKRVRDTTAYVELKPKRGRGVVEVIVHELDDYGEPYSSTPLDTPVGVLTSVTKPEGDAGGDDAATLTLSVEVGA